MKRPTNLKAVPPDSTDKLTYDEVDRLASSVGSHIEDAPRESLMILMQEISRHPFDHSHVEGIANLLLRHLFAWTPQADAAEGKFIADVRAKLVGKGGAR